MFNVVGEANGIVDHSAVTQTGGPDGSADFQLRVPSGNLSQTLARLSALRGAQVVSRTDNSQDVNSQYVSAKRQLADDQALRTGLLKQLAAAVTQQQIDSLKAQLRNAEAIDLLRPGGAAPAQLPDRLQPRHGDHQRRLGTHPGDPPQHSGGFTLGHAAHVAGRVLVVAAGVGLDRPRRLAARRSPGRTGRLRWGSPWAPARASRRLTWPERGAARRRAGVKLRRAAR